ncbi:kunitz-type serine protease inhibitor 2 [Biomphalaria pfeifferi]|uniref:Kunitz-type serine protease inhibitor 2 n=1 Tax=Biomphalaria pfeifferi TaxID=112525 RepID=A0AAD8FHZ0_BIOPF|nr:kunitz-type serine protease inhibitor 2 [Biomphalaria pfeifferi]
MMTKITLLCLFGMLCIQLSTQSTNPICSLAPDAGPCRAREPRYHFNSVTGFCEIFYYGGCDGNDNNFVNPDDCTALCGGTTPPARK